MAIGFWMNNKNCYGCKTCYIACKSEKQLDKGVLLRHVTAIRQDAPRAFAYLSMACNHCEAPACVANCPVGAYSKLEDGATAAMIGASAVSCLRAWPPAPVQIWPSMTWSLCRARTRPTSCPTRAPVPSPTSSSRWMRPWPKSLTTSWPRTIRRNFPEGALVREGARTARSAPSPPLRAAPFWKEDEQCFP